MKGPDVGREYLKIVALFIVVIAIYQVGIYYEILPGKWMGYFFGGCMCLIWFRYSGIQMLREFGFIKKKPLPEDYKLAEPPEPILGPKANPGKAMLILFGFMPLMIFIQIPVYFGLYYFPKNIFDGQAFVKTQLFNNIGIAYGVLIVLTSVYAGYRGLKIWFGK